MNLLKVGKAALASFAILSSMQLSAATPAQEKIIEKGYSQEWVNSLTAKGKKEVWSKDQLKYIGMPIGGMFAGQVYMGGDGDLWYWDIQNKRFYGPGFKGDAYYIKPMTQDKYKQVDQGFYISTESAGLKQLNKNGFNDIKFNGQYPIANVSLQEDGYPIAVDLQAYSPFSPTATDDSSLPITVLEYTLKNTTNIAQKVEIGGWLENIASKRTGVLGTGQLQNRVITSQGMTSVVCESLPVDQKKTTKADVVFEDFEGGTYDKWTVEGKAFGAEPFVRTDFAPHHKVSGHQGTVLVNSHNTREVASNNGADGLTGSLTSKEFTITHDYISMVVSGGNHKGKTEVQLIIDGKVVDAIQGNNSNKMVPKNFFVQKYLGKTAQLKVVDKATDNWAHIGVDYIVFTMNPKGTEAFQESHDYGNMTLAILDDQNVKASADVSSDALATAFDEVTLSKKSDIGKQISGGVNKTLELAPGESKTVKFAISWYFPNINSGERAMNGLKDMKNQKNYYTKFFQDSSSVAYYLNKNYNRLSGMTKNWVDTWYDSSLPNWFLDRSFLNVSTLASTVWHRFHNPKNATLDGRPYCWEGAYLGDGSCTHVLHYEQAMGRVFPDVTSDMREIVDYGLAFGEETGYIKYRAEFGYGHHKGYDHAVDGHAGTILRMYREYTLNPDAGFLVRNWPRVKKSIYCLINQDKELTGEADGILEGRQYNTLDRIWYGKVPWISGLYNAVLLAGEKMANDLGDEAFAKECSEIAQKGKISLNELYNGEYFYQKIDPKHNKTPNSNIGCHIDQLLGQYFAEQLQLGDAFDDDKAKKALDSIFKYNFLKDIGTWQENAKVKPLRRFSLPDEAGTTMCSFPKGQLKTGTSKEGVIGGYFSEAWTGQEHAVAALMIDKGMVEQGLAVVKAVHERYAPEKRNPYNEIEYGNHYSRAMSSYAPFVSISGFSHHALKAQIGFAPKLNAEKFKSAFIAAESWGSFEQEISGSKQTEKLTVNFGKLAVKELSFEGKASTAIVTVNNVAISADFSQIDGKLILKLANKLELTEGDTLKVEFK